MQAKQDLLFSISVEYATMKSIALTISHSGLEISVLQPDLNKTIELQSLDIASRARGFGEQFALENLVRAAQCVWNEL